MSNLFGKYRAQVVDNNDPEGRARLLVKAPKVSGEHELGWAESCLPPGVFILPKVDDFVYIEFERGEIDYPVWVGILMTRAYIKEHFFPTGVYDPSVAKIVAEDDLEILPGNELKIGSGSDVQRIARVGDKVAVQNGLGTLQGTITESDSKAKSF